MIKNFVSNLIKKIFIFQEKFLENKYKQKKTVLKTTGTNSKNHITSSASLTLNLKFIEDKKKFEEKVKLIAKENFENLINYIKTEGAEVYFIKNAKKVLSPINKEEGFILPQRSFCALYLNLLLNKKVSFKTKEIFVFENKEINNHKLLYNFYLWMAYKAGFLIIKNKNKKTLEQLEKLDFSKLNLEEIMELKDEVSIEKDALKFSLDFIKEFEGSKKAYNAFKNNGANL